MREAFIFVRSDVMFAGINLEITVIRSGMSATESVNDFVMQYPFTSCLAPLGEKQKLELAPARSVTVSPHLFEGRLLSPRIAATMLVLLPKLAMTRFHVPPNMLARILSLADPVVTCSRDIIRLESFSACGSAYARMDIDSDACEGEFLGRGTTNVDFQQALRDALVALNSQSKLDLAIGKSEVKLSIENQQFIEKKVQLPSRWVRGFAEVSAYQANMVLVHDLQKVTATRFLQTLTSSNSEKGDYYVVLRGKELSLTQQKQANAVKVAGLSRLKLLKSLIPYIDRVRIYSDPSGNASSWLISAGPYKFEFVISAATYRGFSGEGQLLEELARADLAGYLHQVRASLNWQSKIDLQQIALDFGTTIDIIKACLHNLGSGGLVGYDCASLSYFHRELPFKPNRSVSLNPRLRGAKKIIEGDAVEIVDANDEYAEAHVAGSGITHIVRCTADGSTCTCLWYAKHQGQRGPCKHILSVHMLLEKADGRH